MDIVEKRISQEAVTDATGKTWVEWFLFLDAERAYELDHMAIVTLLENYVESIWWRQTISSEYERMYGLSPSEAGSYQAESEKTFRIAPKKAWDLLISPVGMRTWLGAGVKADPRDGVTYATADDVQGEFRIVKKMSHLRLTWQPPGWEEASTLQVRVVPKGPKKSAICFHHEGLPGEQQREEMQLRWHQVLQELEDQAAR